VGGGVVGSKYAISFPPEVHWGCWGAVLGIFFFCLHCRVLSLGF
jgi:hypothetical protein